MPSNHGPGYTELERIAEKANTTIFKSNLLLPDFGRPIDRKCRFIHHGKRVDWGTPMPPPRIDPPHAR